MPYQLSSAKFTLIFGEKIQFKKMTAGSFQSVTEERERERERERAFRRFEDRVIMEDAATQPPYWTSIGMEAYHAFLQAHLASVDREKKAKRARKKKGKDRTLSFWSQVRSMFCRQRDFEDERRNEIVEEVHPDFLRTLEGHFQFLNRMSKASQNLTSARVQVMQKTFQERLTSAQELGTPASDFDCSYETPSRARLNFLLEKGYDYHALATKHCSFKPLEPGALTLRTPPVNRIAEGESEMFDWRVPFILLEDYIQSEKKRKGPELERCVETEESPSRPCLSPCSLQVDKSEVKFKSEAKFRPVKQSQYGSYQSQSSSFATTFTSPISSKMETPSKSPNYYSPASMSSAKNMYRRSPYSLRASSKGSCCKESIPENDEDRYAPYNKFLKEHLLPLEDKCANQSEGFDSGFDGVCHHKVRSPASVRKRQTLYSPPVFCGSDISKAKGEPVSGMVENFHQSKHIADFVEAPNNIRIKQEIDDDPSRRNLERKKQDLNHEHINSFFPATFLSDLDRKSAERAPHTNTESALREAADRNKKVGILVKPSPDTVLEEWVSPDFGKYVDRESQAFQKSCETHVEELILQRAKQASEHFINAYFDHKKLLGPKVTRERKEMKSKEVKESFADNKENENSFNSFDFKTKADGWNSLHEESGPIPVSYPPNPVSPLVHRRI